MPYPLMLGGVVPLKSLLSAAPPLLNSRYPFLPGQQCLLQTDTATTPYGAGMPARNSRKLFIATLTAALGAAEIDIAVGAIGHSTLSTGLDAAVDTGIAGPTAPQDILRAVVIREATGQVLRRRGSDIADGALSADSFKVKTTTAGAGVIRVRGPAAGSWKAGEQLRIVLLETTDIFGAVNDPTTGASPVVGSAAALNPNRHSVGTVFELMYAAVAANSEVDIQAMLAA